MKNSHSRKKSSFLVAFKIADQDRCGKRLLLRSYKRKPENVCQCTKSLCFPNDFVFPMIILRTGDRDTKASRVALAPPSKTRTVLGALTRPRSSRSVSISTATSISGCRGWFVTLFLHLVIVTLFLPPPDEGRLEWGGRTLCRLQDAYTIHLSLSPRGRGGGIR